MAQHILLLLFQFHVILIYVVSFIYYNYVHNLVNLVFPSPTSTLLLHLPYIFPVEYKW
jgi:hypothetical protein